MKRTISFRANDEDNSIIERYKQTGGNIRNITDSDTIRYALSLIDEKKNIKKNSDNVIPDDEKLENREILTVEEKARGYQYIRGELCDAQGFPVDQDANLVIRNGEVYATDPGRKELKEMAKENSEKIIAETPYGKVNDKMVELLEDAPKSEAIIKHNEPGMTEIVDGVDQDFNEDNFVN